MRCFKVEPFEDEGNGSRGAIFSVVMDNLAQLIFGEFDPELSKIIMDEHLREREVGFLSHCVYGVKLLKLIVKLLLVLFEIAI
jgi:hypothetical protein